MHLFFLSFCFRRKYNIYAKAKNTYGYIEVGANMKIGSNPDNIKNGTCATITKSVGNVVNDI